MVAKILGCIAVLAILVWLFLPRPARPYGRETYILVSDPMVIVSWGQMDHVLTLISLPADIAAEGTHGYGTYSLAAFWRLGEIDKKDGTVLAESVSEALGIPIDGYIGPKTGMFSSSVKSVFSLKNIFSYIAGRYRTNISFKTFLNFAGLLNFSRPNRIDTYDFTKNSSIIAQNLVLPDGSLQQELDPERLDAQLKSVFEDQTVRQESVTVAVYNTTAMPSLGNRAGRLLTKLGVSVVTVGNDLPETGSCTISGSDTALKSKSAQVIIAVLACKQVVGSESRADLIIRIGKVYAKRFLPNQ